MDTQKNICLVNEGMSTGTLETRKKEPAQTFVYQKQSQYTLHGRQQVLFDYTSNLKRSANSSTVCCCILTLLHPMPLSTSEVSASPSACHGAFISIWPPLLWVCTTIWEEEKWDLHVESCSGPVTLGVSDVSDVSIGQNGDAFFFGMTLDVHLSNN